MGAILLGEAESATRFLHAFDRGAALPDDSGPVPLSGGGGGRTAGYLEAPDERRSATATGVSKGEISLPSAAEAHAQALCDATRAATGCGSCKKDVKALFE